MSRPPVPRQALDAALQAHAGGASVAEAAARAGIGERTLKRYLAASRASGAASPPQAPQRLVQVQRAAPAAEEPPPSAALEALEAGEPEESLLKIVRAELRYARDQRKAVVEDAAKRGWSKRVDELVRAVERFEPPPAPPPDALVKLYRSLDAEVVELLEQHLPDRIDPKEIAA